MGSKQWIRLVIVAFVIAALMIGWELFLTFAGYKGDFSYALTPIEPYLYEQLAKHFEADPKYSEYQQEAQIIESIDFFGDKVNP